MNIVPHIHYSLVNKIMYPPRKYCTPIATSGCCIPYNIHCVLFTVLHGKGFIASFSKHLSRCALIIECLKSRHKAQICSFICVGRSECRLSYTFTVERWIRPLANGYSQNAAPAQTLPSSPQMLMCNTVAYSGGQALDISMLTVHKQPHCTQACSLYTSMFTVHKHAHCTQACSLYISCTTYSILYISCTAYSTTVHILHYLQHYTVHILHCLQHYCTYVHCILHYLYSTTVHILHYL